MFELDRFDCIIVPLATDAMILNLHYKTTKFISLSEIFFQDTFVYIPKLSFSLTEEKCLRRFCTNKQIGFVQLPKIYDMLSMFLLDLGCQMIFLSTKQMHIKQQHICKNLLDEYDLLQKLDQELTHNFPHHMTGVDHNMLRMLMPERRIICTLWETEYGQNLYRMACYLFYYDEQLKDEYILKHIPVSDIEALNSLRDFSTVLSPEALFTEQIKLLGGTHALIGSFVRFAMLHYQQVHAHYLTLLALFLKHKYVMYPTVKHPVYPIHVLRFFDKECLLAGFAEKDEYYDFTLQTLHTGNSLYLLHTSQYIEQIAHDVSINFDSQTDKKEIILEPKVESEPIITRIIPHKQDEYDVTTFLSLVKPIDTEKIEELSIIQNVLHKVFDLFVAKQDVTVAYQELGGFDATLVKNMYQNLLYVYDDLMNDLQLSLLAIQKQYTRIYIEKSTLEYPVHLASSHYYIYVSNTVYLFFIAFNCQNTLSYNSLIRIYLAYQYWDEFLQQTHQAYQIHLYYINLDGYKEIEYQTLLKACKGFLQDVFKLREDE